eukprot:6189953-Pleurochrysis_carterae.AAC.2
MNRNIGTTPQGKLQTWQIRQGISALGGPSWIACAMHASATASWFELQSPSLKEKRSAAVAMRSSVAK